MNGVGPIRTEGNLPMKVLGKMSSLRPSGACAAVLAVGVASGSAIAQTRIPGESETADPDGDTLVIDVRPFQPTERPPRRGRLPGPRWTPPPPTLEGVAERLGDRIAAWIAESPLADEDPSRATIEVGPIMNRWDPGSVTDEDFYGFRELLYEQILSNDAAAEHVSVHVRPQDLSDDAEELGRWQRGALPESYRPVNAVLDSYDPDDIYVLTFKAYTAGRENRLTISMVRFGNREILRPQWRFEVEFE